MCLYIGDKVVRTESLKVPGLDGAVVDAESPTDPFAFNASPAGPVIFTDRRRTKGQLGRQPRGTDGGDAIHPTRRLCP